jgi:MraZ protein
LEKDVVVIGVLSRVEIWSKNRWDDYNARAAASYEELAENIVDSNIGI